MKRGRPRINPEVRKSRTIMVRVSKDEYARIQKRIVAAIARTNFPMNMSDYVRMRIL